MTAPQWIISIVVLALVFLGYRAYTRRSPSQGPPARPADPNEVMPGMAERAVEYAAERGKTLDYSRDSVKAVEAILSELHESRSNKQLSDRDVNLHALHFGAYLGEVLRRQYGGSWSKDHPVAGPGSFPIHWNGGDSFPIGWCGKRILNGDEDNVWVKFHVLTSGELKHDPTTRPSALD